MSPELLQVLTAAKGLPMPIEEGVQVDTLTALFRQERRLRDMAQRLRKQGRLQELEQLVQQEPHAQTATGRNTKSLRPHEWTHAECALACQGLDERYFDAMRYTYALDDSCFFRLANRLCDWAYERRERERWPMNVVKTSGTLERYMRDLVDMWLLEVRQPWRFARTSSTAPGLHRVIMDVSEIVWRRKLSPIYEVIGEEFVTWLSIAHAHMAHHLREDAA